MLNTRPAGRQAVPISMKWSSSAHLALLARSVLSDRRSAIDAHYRVFWSISRLSQHRMTPPDVPDAKGPVIRPSGGPETDVTVSPRALIRTLARVVGEVVASISRPQNVDPGGSWESHTSGDTMWSFNTRVIDEKAS